ncbi:MAG: nucleotidyltransferase family protein [Caulobacteraceae bacterium]|nr:nucleotidyltransferase family protein [Caulobacteraceae bacterium]
MVLAAGLGVRMRPLTLDRPKALVEVGGRPLIDHVLDRLVAAGVRRAVVNVHAFADQMEAHLAGRRDLDFAVADERAALLETGGGLKAARSWLGDQPIFVANIDTLWTERGQPALDRLKGGWRGADMDALLLLCPAQRAIGFSGPGDFDLEANGRLRHRGAAPQAAFAYMGVQILNPRAIDAWPATPHGLFGHWMEMARAGRLHGVAAAGTWMHVGDPEARLAAERRLAEEAAA